MREGEAASEPVYQLHLSLTRNHADGTVEELATFYRTSFDAAFMYGLFGDTGSSMEKAISEHERT